MAVLCRAVNKKWVTFERGPGGSLRRVRERAPEGVHKQVQDEVREKDAVRQDDDQKCLEVKTQIRNSEANQKRNDSPNSSREFTHHIWKSKLQFEICKRNKRRRAPRASSPRVRPKKNMKLHHPSTPDRQRPTDSVSPNHHGHRSRSENDNFAQF